VTQAIVIDMSMAERGAGGKVAGSTFYIAAEIFGSIDCPMKCTVLILLFVSVCTCIDVLRKRPVTDRKINRSFFCMDSAFDGANSFEN
jgi:hypothetical protein